MKHDREYRKRRIWWPGAVAVIVLALMVVATLVVFDVLYPRGIGIRQPIPFSHRVHVHIKHISCLMCHTQVTESARAGIPPLQTCMLCHSRIITTFPPIVNLRQHFEQGKPILWERVNWVPEFVYFNHSVHIYKGIDCGRCHGNVALMDRVVPAQKFKMGFCIQCHREKNATHDCFTCHR